MREYKVQIRELLEMTVTVEAISARQAMEIIEKGHKNSLDNASQQLLRRNFI